MKFVKTANSETINNLRTEFYKSLTAPLDSMWQDLYIASSQASLIEKNNKHIGYCCIDGNNSLLQLYVNNENKYLTITIVEQLIEFKLITSASLSSIEPILFNACLHLSKSIKTNTFCYEYSKHSLNYENILNIELVTPKDSQIIRDFYKNHIGFEDTFGYVDNLISRKELFMVKESNTITTTGECRLSDTQKNHADVGVAVNKEYRKKGLATKMLQQLAREAIKQKRKPICSTTIDNIGSQKAIEKAGFHCSNIFLIWNLLKVKIKTYDLLRFRL